MFFSNELRLCFYLSLIFILPNMSYCVPTLLQTEVFCFINIFIYST